MYVTYSSVPVREHSAFCEHGVHERKCYEWHMSGAPRVQQPQRHHHWNLRLQERTLLCRLVISSYTADVYILQDTRTIHNNDPNSVHKFDFLRKSIPILR